MTLVVTFFVTFGYDLERKENALQFLFLLVSLVSDTGGSIRGYSGVSIPIFPNLDIPFDVNM